MHQFVRNVPQNHLNLVAFEKKTLKTFIWANGANRAWIQSQSKSYRINGHLFTRYSANPGVEFIDF